jgi:AcrR family transcriptional regulator
VPATRLHSQLWNSRVRNMQRANPNDDTNAALEGKRRDRADPTRERMQDAVEALIAESGYAGLTHRRVAARANAHPALLNYHFSTMTRLVDQVVARKANRLIEQWEAALAQCRPGPTGVADVLRAYWAPFDRCGSEVPSCRIGSETPSDSVVSDSVGSETPPWDGYLCALAHVFTDAATRPIRYRRFGKAERAFADALAAALPGVGRGDADAAFDTVQIVLDELRLRRCRQPAVPGADDGTPGNFAGVDMLLRLLTKGIEGLGEPS